MPHTNENFQEYFQEYRQNLRENAIQNDECDIDIDQLHRIDPMSPLLDVIDENGEEKLIPKSTYLWMITEPGVKLSNDRTRRFMSNTGKKRKVIELNS